MRKIDSERAFQLAKDAHSALGADVLMMYAFKDGGYTGDIVGFTDKLPVGMEEVLRKAADYIERSRT
jgi:hypothetical protein